MPASLSRLQVENYRCLAKLSLDLGPVNVFFGPNGSGKSTILDTIWFFRDCTDRGIILASSVRGHGIGMLWDGAGEAEQIAITLADREVEYEIRLGLSGGRINPLPGEVLRSLTSNKVLIHRDVGSDRANVYHHRGDRLVPVLLREPDHFNLGRYLDVNEGMVESVELYRLLHFVRHYHCRSFALDRLKRQGSEVSHQTGLRGRGDNCWSVLRNLHDRRDVDDRYGTIMQLMARSFPSFDGLLLEQTGPTTVYATFREKGRRKDIWASGVSDGHLQMLLLLTALFCEEPARPAVLLFDEPEISLHPWALSVFADAVEMAAAKWNKQVLIATHSPALLSAFPVERVLATETQEGRTRVRRLGEMEELKDLLDQYATGSLYMAQVVGDQANGLPVTAEH